MPVTCPSCGQPASEGARVCKGCGAALSKRCPHCAEWIAVLAARCPFCAADLAGGPAPVLRTAHAAPAGGISPGAGRVGERRELILAFLLTFVTCGIFGLYLMYKIGDELNEHSGSSGLNPGLDILLGLLTCGLWFIYARYRYAETLRDLSVREGGEAQDVTTLCLVLDIAALCFGFTALVSLLVLQNEVNRHWERHAA